MVKLEDETGKLIYSNYGKIGALLLSGDQRFINQIFNLCINFGITQKKKLYKYYDTGYYILTTQGKVINGLTSYFAGQIILNNEVEPKEIKDNDDCIVNLVYDDNEINKLAANKAINFWMNKIEKKDIMMEGYNHQGVGISEYGVVSIKSRK